MKKQLLTALETISTTDPIEDLADLVTSCP